MRRGSRAAGAQSLLPLQGEVPNVRQPGPGQHEGDWPTLPLWLPGARQGSQLHGNTECVQSGQWTMLVKKKKGKHKSKDMEKPTRAQSHTGLAWSRWRWSRWSLYSKWFMLQTTGSSWSLFPVLLLLQPEEGRSKGKR